MTDLHHPAIEGLRVARITARNYGLPDPAPPQPQRSPEEIRQLLDKLQTNSRQPQDKHHAQPLGSADAI